LVNFTDKVDGARKVGLYRYDHDINIEEEFSIKTLGKRVV
jgi:hypothetical protein